MKSTLKQKQPLDINKEIQITRLHADPNMIQQHVKNLKNLFKNESDQQINQRVTQIIARDNIFNAIMNEIVHNYDITFDEQELTQLVERIKPQFQNRSDDVLREIARKIIIKSLIFQQLAKE
jgi:FKBP-type peptidyl-prolyl cis-trans isomerase (trigger factor)